MVTTKSKIAAMRVPKCDVMFAVCKMLCYGVLHYCPQDKNKRDNHQAELMLSLLFILCMCRNGIASQLPIRRRAISPLGFDRQRP